MTCTEALPSHHDGETTVTTTEYRKSRPEDRAAILQVLDESKDQAHIEAHQGTFDYQFGAENPHGDGIGALWVVTVDGEIAGVNGLMPAKIRYQKESIDAVWSCDTAVSSRFRGKGLGKGLLARVSAGAEVVMGYGISDMSDPILSKMGWDLVPEARGFFFYVAEEGAKGLIKNARSSLVRLALGPSKSGEIEVEIHDGKPFGADVDQLWKASVPGYVSVVERDAAYLNWRYHRHPRLRYVAYYARRAGELVGVLIARPDAIEAVIVDYCGPAQHPDIKAALLEAAVSDLSRRGTRRIRCETTDADLIDVLGREGFRETNAKFRFRVWSNRKDDHGRAEGWFLMTGDSDNDLAALGTPTDSGVASKRGPLDLLMASALQVMAATLQLMASALK
jgi:GNAT superfamily N-acetyltransferase